MQLISRLSYSAFFNNEPESLNSLLSSIPLSFTLLFLTQLIKKEKSFKSDKDELEFIIQEWLASVPHKTRENIARKFAEKIEVGDQERSLVVINLISSLRFMEFALHYQKDDFINEDYKTLEINLFKAYLIFNSLEEKNQLKLHEQLKLDNLYTEEAFFNYRLAVSPFEHQIQYYKYKKQLWVQLMKYFQFLEFANKAEVSNFKTTIDEYLLNNGINDWKHYFMSSFELIRAAQETGIVHFGTDEATQYYKGILSRFSFKKTESKYDKNDFLRLRKYPLYQIEENKVLILHLPFLMDKFFKSVYFDLTNYLKNNYESGENGFKQIYEQNFGEEFLLVNSIKLLFRNKYIQIKGRDIPNKNLAFPDYYVRNGNKIFLFENKYIKLSDKVKIGYNVLPFKAEIKEKLFRTKSGKKKGALQLLNCVKNSINGKYTDYDKPRLKSAKYYPIIIVEDYSFCTFGINKLLNDWFKNEVNEDSDILNKSNIMNLTIINIDDFLFYNYKLSKLDSLIKEYHIFSEGNSNYAGISFTEYLDIIKFPNYERIKKKEVNHIFTEPFKFYDE